MKIGIVTIRDKVWNVLITETLSEMATGLGGQTSLPAGNGMLFPIVPPRTVVVTTVPMLFNIDIGFIRDGAVYRIVDDAEPGNLVESIGWVDYFLEVNEVELLEIQPGDLVSIVVTGDVPAEPTNMMSMMTPMITMIMMIIIVSMMSGVMKQTVYADTQQQMDNPMTFYQTEIDEAFRQAIGRANKSQ